MAPSFGVSWLCALFWGCITFSPQGNIFVHAYYQYDNPATSAQYYSGVSSNTDYGNAQHGRIQQSYAPLQRQPGIYTNQKNFNPATPVRGGGLQGQLDPGQGFTKTSATPTQKSDETLENRHPFGILMQQKNQQVPVKGISFPTINHFQRFVENMKTAFLTPGSDLSKHFKGAREAMKELDQESRQGYESAQQGAVPVAHHGNDVWSGHGASYQMMPDGRRSFPDSAGSAAGLISPNAYGRPEFRPGSVPYPHQQLAATQHVQSNVPNRRGNDIYNSALQNQRFQSTGYNQAGQTHFPSGSLYGADSSNRGYVKAPNSNPQYSQYQDYSYYAPLKPKYTPTDPRMAYQTQSQGSEPRQTYYRGVQDNVPPQMPPALNSHDQRYYAATGQPYIPANPPRQREKPVRPVQSTIYSPSIYPPGSTASASPSSNNFLPQRSDSHVGFHTRRPQNQVFNQQQPDRSNTSNMKSPSSVYGARNPDIYPEYQKVGPTPSTPTTSRKSKLNRYHQKRAPVRQKHNANPRSQWIDSSRRGTTSHTARNPRKSFSGTPRLSLNDGMNNPTPHKNYLQSSMQGDEPVDSIYFPSDEQSPPKDCVVWTKGGNTNNSPSKPSTLSALIKSRNRSGGATAYLSKLCYRKFALDQDKKPRERWKIAQRRRLL